MSTDAGTRVEYVRRLFDDVRRWYDNADSKAQVVLAMDGAFLAFLTGSILAKPEDIKLVVHSFSNWTWAFLALMTFCLIASIASAIYCLRSRTYSVSELDDWIAKAQRQSNNPAQYAPEIMWFFQAVARLDDAQFRRTLEGVTSQFELEAMASQIRLLSKNVAAKHHAVNIGFLTAAATLLLFLLAGLSYLARVPSS